ncbi:hypothetical protein BJ741DRAFT_578493 [Chytriomyces cf. hyalinus JEL632]|nr:hypothetical protein BJ741DRAFT_578493 [Chytriomyces cf. hyalinus JEL632]
MCLSLKTGTVTRCKALANLGHMAGVAGDIETALSRYMDAIETDANQPTAYQNILLNLHYFATPDLRTSKALRRVLSKLYPCQKDSVPDDPPPDVGGTHRDLTRKLTIGCIQGISAVQVVTQIQRDRVDILIDLSGHAAGNRLDVFALHPVPMMLSYCGYPNITGINGLRRISDSYTEKFNPKVQDEAVLLPCLVLSFTPQPLSRECNIWMLCETPKNQPVPNSKLILKARAFDDPSVETIWKNKFGPEFQSRITLLRHTTTPVNYLESFKLIDIHLDTFPYSGTTITCESSYLNVPVVTFAPVSIRSVGHVARVSGSILAEMGFGKQLVANTQAHVRAAFCNVVLASSPAGKDFVRDFEDLVTDEFLKASSSQSILS